MIYKCPICHSEHETFKENLVSVVCPICIVEMDLIEPKKGVNQDGR